MQEDNASLEEILASIKSMMARDDADRRATNVGEPGSSEPTQADTSVDQANAQQAAAMAKSPNGGEELVPNAAPDARPAPPASERLTRAATVAAIRQSLAALDWMGQEQDAPAPGSASIETLTRTMLRPMLAEWLDANLPALVERMVEAEIARLMRRDD